MYLLTNNGGRGGGEEMLEIMGKEGKLRLQSG